MKRLLERLRLTIGAKLIGLIAILLIASVVSLVFLSTRMFIEDNTTLIQQMNADTASGLASQTRELFDGLTEKSRLLGAALYQDFRIPEGKERIAKEFFTKDRDILGVFIHTRDADGKVTLDRHSASPDMADMNDPLGDKLWAELAKLPDFSWDPAFQGEAQVYPAKLADGKPAVVYVIPFIQGSDDKFTHILSGVLRQTRVLKAFAESALIESFLVDRKGRLLAHPDTAPDTVGRSVSYLEIVQQLLSGKFNNGQTRYLDPQGNIWRLGAFRLVGFGGMGVVADVPEAKAFEAAKRVEKRAIYVAVFILCLAFMAGYFYSGTITWPIKQLVEASRRISEGDFKIQLRPRGRDEIATLSNSFNEMAKGLEERDRVKETFNKFHNKEIAEKLLSGEVKLGGERKDATIFFSDVRGFTAMSESMAPEDVVVLLNEYMTRMVSVIRQHGGIVDKYVGDAIMALWGVPISKNAHEETYQAVKACLEMRRQLADLNQLRLSRGQHALKIGMGLNCGQVIAGNIGSEEKMEYTVIGDTVNTASRMESMTKEYGTDLLIPKEIYERVKDRFVFETCEAVKVKGKTSAIDVFKVKGYIDEAGNQVIIETPYSSYESEKSDKAAH